MPTENFPREQFAADVAKRLRDLERAGEPSARAPANGPGRPPVYGLIATGADGAVTFLDPTAAEATGWPADDGIGKPGGQVLRVVAPDGAQDVLATAHRDGAIYQLQRARIRRRDGRESDVAITVAPIMRDGKPGGALAVIGAPAVPSEGAAAGLEALGAVWEVLADAPAPRFEDGAEHILEAALTVLEGDRAVLALAEPSPLVIAVPRWRPTHFKAAPGTPIPRGVPVLGRGGVRSLAAAPVRSGDRTVGTLSVSSSQREHFDLGRVRLLESVAGALGALWAHDQQRRAAEASRAREDALREAVSIMSGTGPIAERAARLLRVAAGAASASFAGLAVAEPGSARLSWIATLEPAGLSAQSAGGSSLADGMLALDRPLLIRDVAGSTAWPIPGLGGDARSALALPVRADDETLGAMVVVSARADAFDPPLVEALAAMAQTAATALQYLRRDVFVSAAAHALRTPMTPILGYAELLIGRQVGDAQRTEWLGYVHDATTRALKVVDDLLQMTHLLSRNLSMEIEPLDLGPLLERTAASFRASEGMTIEGMTIEGRASEGRAGEGRAGGGAREIVLDLPQSLPKVLGDPARIAQAAAALLSNALKFSPGGGEVRVDARYEWGRKRVVVSFTDHGVGIAPDDLERIFAPFERAYDPATRDVHGGGLGLTIVRQLVALMHGSMWVESELGHGSVFHLALPTAERAKGAAERAKGAAEGAKGAAEGGKGSAARAQSQP